MERRSSCDRGHPAVRSRPIIQPSTTCCVRVLKALQCAVSVSQAPQQLQSKGRSNSGQLQGARPRGTASTSGLPALQRQVVMFVSSFIAAQVRVPVKSARATVELLSKRRVAMLSSRMQCRQSVAPFGARPGGSRTQKTASRLACSAEGRLVGCPAPDFEATAVYDQEFMDIKLSDYKCGGRPCVLTSSLPP